MLADRRVGEGAESAKRLFQYSFGINEVRVHAVAGVPAMVLIMSYFFRFSREEGCAVGLGSCSVAEARRHIELFFPTNPNSNLFLR